MCAMVPLNLIQECGTLKVSGYVRGRALSVNQLVHIPGVGDFQMSQVDLLSLHDRTDGYTYSRLATD